MLKKLTLIGLGASVFVAGLTAADFWTKSYAEWTDQEVQKMITDSPWAERMQVETGARGAISNADDKGGPIQGNLTTPVVLLWQSALPVKQAMYGRASATDAQKQILAREESFRILRATGIPGSMRATAEDKEKLIAATVIKIKGKPDLHPSDIQLSAAPGGGEGKGFGGGGKGGFGGGFGNFDIFFVFPKDAPITADDKEFEFQTKLGAMSIRHKFKTKDMMYNGKLEM